MHRMPGAVRNVSAFIRSQAKPLLTQENYVEEIAIRLQTRLGGNWYIKQ